VEKGVRNNKGSTISGNRRVGGLWGKRKNDRPPQSRRRDGGPWDAGLARRQKKKQLEHRNRGWALTSKHKPPRKKGRGTLPGSGGGRESGKPTVRRVLGEEKLAQLSTSDLCQASRRGRDLDAYEQRKEWILGRKGKPYTLTTQNQKKGPISSTKREKTTSTSKKEKD